MKLLWIGDAVMQTGFARVTHNILDRLCQSHEVVVLGINYNGDPPNKPYPYRIYPAANGGDVWGVHRTEPVCKIEKPDVVCILQDPWNVLGYLPEIDGIPIVAYMPVDAPNQVHARKLNGLTKAISYTHFGRKELLLGGYTGECAVVPHGVDMELYRPIARAEARAELQLSKHISPDAFIVGNINRNQPRKRLDLTIQAWTQWWVNAGQPANAYLYLHCSNNDIGVNVLQLTKYYGIQSQLIITDPNMAPSASLPEDKMPYLYNAIDAQITTTLGEGWGLTNHEGMACGIPQIMPRYAALAEWADGAARFVDIISYQVTCNRLNTIGGVVSVDGIADAIDELYRDHDLRQSLGVAALKRATEERFTWNAIARQFDRILTDVVTNFKPAEEQEVAHGQVQESAR